MTKTILGIDPGLATTGWAVLSVKDLSYELVACGAIETGKQHTLPERCQEIYGDVQQLLQQYQPTLAVVEELFFSKNVKTAIQVAHARGSIMAACATAAIPIVEINPRVMKKRITGYGQADKKQVAYMMHNLLELEDLPKLDDTVDAIALAYAAAHEHF